MVVRRFRDHVADHNWFAVATDLGIVVAGVFLGTQANNWNQSRLDRRQGEEYRERLIDDLRANRSDFGQRIIYYQQVHDFGYAALQDLRRARSDDPVAFLFDAYQATQILPRTAQRTTYEEILSAGATGMLGDESIRQQIANYYFNLDTTNATIATVPPYRDRVRRGMPYEVQRAIRTDCSESYREDSTGRPTTRLPTGCRPRLAPADAVAAAAKVREIPEIELDLTRSLVDDDQKVLQFQTMDRRAGALLARLEASVASREEP